MFSSSERGTALALCEGVREAGISQKLLVSFLISFHFTGADVPESFFLSSALGDEQGCKHSPSPRSEGFRQTSCFYLLQGVGFHRWVQCWMHNSSLRQKAKLWPGYCHSGNSTLKYSLTYAHLRQQDVVSWGGSLLTWIMNRVLCYLF